MATREHFLNQMALQVFDRAYHIHHDHVLIHVFLYHVVHHGLSIGMVLLLVITVVYSCLQTQLDYVLSTLLE